MLRRLLSVFGAVFVVLLSSTAALTNNNNDNRASEATVASHGDPFATCMVIGANTVTSIAVNYPDTEPEPWLASHPGNSRILVGSYQQDRWNDGGAKGLVAAYSSNGGNTWKSVPLPFSQCAAPYYGGNVLHYERASDAWNSIGVDGIAYAVSISFSNDGTNAVGAARSTDGGRSWTNQQAVIADGAAAFNDKESVTADPKLPGTAYIVWDRSFVGPCPPGQRAKSGIPASQQRRLSKERPAGSARSSGIKTPAQTCFFQPTFFSRTTDGGITWEAPRPIAATAPDEATLGNVIVVNHQTGALYDFYTHFDATGVAVELVISTDKGTTWSNPQVVSDEQVTGVFDPRNRSEITVRSGDIVSPAIDPNSGQLYVAWEDSRFNGGQNDQAVISTSSTGLTGTWTPPSLISPPGDPAAFTPTIDVNRLGEVGALFYDLRNLKPSTPPSILPTDTWFRRTDGPGLTFTHEVHLGSYNMLMSPVAIGGFFVGDYEGIAARPDSSFAAFFTQAVCGDVSCPSGGNGIGAPSQAPDSQNVYASTIGKADNQD